MPKIKKTYCKPHFPKKNFRQPGKDFLISLILNSNFFWFCRTENGKSLIFSKICKKSRRNIINANFWKFVFHSQVILKNGNYSQRRRREEEEFRFWRTESGKSIIFSNICQNWRRPIKKRFFANFFFRTRWALPLSHFCQK